MSPSPPRLSLIAALDRNRLIGVDSQRMPWHLPQDLRHFRRITMAKPIIMGRRTFESIGRPLPGRMNIVLTRGSAIAPQDGLLCTATDLPSARRLAEHWIAERAATDAATPAEVMVIGGAEVYAQTLDAADRLYLTEIDASFDGDNFFPAFAGLQPGWTEVSREPYPAQAAGGFGYAFVVYDRDR